jgi:uncharacterized membrane protein
MSDPLVPGRDPLFVLAVLALCVVGSELFVRRTALRHLGSALVVIVVTAVVANAGLIPTYADGVSAVYDGVFAYVAPLGIFWLLLRVNLRDVRRAGAPMIAAFVAGAVGTILGVVAGMAVVGGEASFGESFRALGGMFVGTYIGGSPNFNAVAAEYGVQTNGVLYASATAVDALMTAVWMAATLAAPRLLGKLRARRAALPVAPVAAGDPAAQLGLEDDTESVHPLDLALLLALGALAWLVSGWLHAWNEDVQSYLVLTGIALVLAQVPAVARLRGSRALGMFAVYLFLAVIGAACDVGALQESGALGFDLLLFVTIVIGVHGALTFGTARALRIDPVVAAVASQANIGGGTTALAVARSLGRPDLVLPGMLVGSLGTALGTALGFFTVDWLL